MNRNRGANSDLRLRNMKEGVAFLPGTCLVNYCGHFLGKFKQEKERCGKLEQEIQTKDKSKTVAEAENLQLKEKIRQLVHAQNMQLKMSLMQRQQKVAGNQSHQQSQQNQPSDGKGGEGGDPTNLLDDFGSDFHFDSLMGGDGGSRGVQRSLLDKLHSQEKVIVPIATKTCFSLNRNVEVARISHIIFNLVGIFFWFIFFPVFSKGVMYREMLTMECHRIFLFGSRDQLNGGN